MLRPLDRRDGPGCVVGVRRAGRTLHLRAYGMANLETEASLETGSVLEAGSVSKQVTAAAVLMLAREGLLSLDDDIRSFIREFPSYRRPVTLRHLLTHTSGVRDQTVLLALAGQPAGSRVQTNADVLDLLGRQRGLNFEPGRYFLYSNSGYTLLAEVVARVTERSLAEWSEEKLFRPLGMQGTRWRDDHRTVVSGRATAYRPRSGGGWFQDMPFAMTYGATGLLTTVPDLLRWNDALAAGRAPLTRELVEAMENPARLADGTSLDYGLGLYLERRRGAREVSHDGTTAGYRAQLSRWPEQQLSIAILCNGADTDPGEYAQVIARGLLGIAEQAPAPAPAAPTEAPDMASLTGLWRDTVFDRLVRIGLQNGRLTISAGGPEVPLVHLGNSRLWNSQTGGFRLEQGGAGWRLWQEKDGVHEYLREPGVVSVDPTQYAGRYWSDELGVLSEVAVGSRGLTIRSGGEPPAPLTPIYRDGFRTESVTIRFQRDSSGVNGFRLYAGRAIGLEFARNR